VWDPDKWIKPESPFPGRNYFILSMARFIEILGSVEEMARKLVWLPTWHQACLTCRAMRAIECAREKSPQTANARTPTEELIRMYELIIDALHSRIDAVARLLEHP
jgi:hypothetical protein